MNTNQPTGAIPFPDVATYTATVSAADTPEALTRLKNQLREGRGRLHHFGRYSDEECACQQALAARQQELGYGYSYLSHSYTERPNPRAGIMADLPPNQPL